MFIRFHQNLYFPDGFSKNTQISNFIQIRQLGAELFHVERTDTERAITPKLTVALRDFANAPKTIHFRTYIYIKFSWFLVRRSNSRILPKYFGYTVRMSSLHFFLSWLQYTIPLHVL
jgi:hypothetical protein